MSNVIINYPAVGATALALLSLFLFSSLSLSLSFYLVPFSFSYIAGIFFLSLLARPLLSLSLFLGLSARAESTTKPPTLRGTGSGSRLTHKCC